MIIGVHGFKQSGKDTLADILVTQYGFKKVAFADNVKEALATIFSIPKDKLWGSDEDKQSLTSVRWNHLEGIQRSDKSNPDFLTIRELMQIFATEICRDKIPSIWYRYLDLKQAEKLVISDLRFENEARHLKDNGATIIAVYRHSAQASSHASESGIPDELIDYSIDNNDSLEALQSKVKELFDKLLN